MIRRSWRSRFVARLVADVARSAQQRAAARTRLFPYAIVDTQADPHHGVVHHRLVLPPVVEEVRPAARSQTNWHFTKR